MFLWRQSGNAGLERPKSSFMVDVWGKLFCHYSNLTIHLHSNVYTCIEWSKFCHLLPCQILGFSSWNASLFLLYNVTFNISWNNSKECVWLPIFNMYFFRIPLVLWFNSLKNVEWAIASMRCHLVKVKHQLQQGWLKKVSKR